jgi:hypothetical protein
MLLWLNGRPSSFRWPCLAISADTARRLELSALGLLASEHLRQGDGIRVRLGQALPALTLPGSRALALPSSRQLGDEPSLLKLRRYKYEQMFGTK